MSLRVPSAERPNNLRNSAVLVYLTAQLSGEVGLRLNYQLLDDFVDPFFFFNVKPIIFLVLAALLQKPEGILNALLSRFDFGGRLWVKEVLAHLNMSLACQENIKGWIVRSWRRGTTCTRLFSTGSHTGKVLLQLVRGFYDFRR